MSTEHQQDEALRAWAAQRSAADPTPAEAAALVARAEALQRPAPRRFVTGAVLLAAAAALLLYAFWPAPDASEPEAPSIALAPEPAPEPVAEPAPPDWLPEGAQAVGDDTLVVAAGARVLVAEAGPQTTIDLDAGSVEAIVSPRAEGGGFTVDAGDYAVSVIGTRFTVEREPFGVSVSEGVVEVRDTRSDRRWRLRAGDRFADGRLIRRPRPPEPPPLPSLDALSQLIRDGELAAAREGLQARLAADPADSDSWYRLAQLEARAGDPSAEAAAWRAVIAHGSARRASLARYELAGLVDDPAEVEALMRAFLPDAGNREADARLRLAKALLAQGRDADARAELERIVTEHPGDAPAVEAQRLLGP